MARHHLPPSQDQAPGAERAGRSCNDTRHNTRLTARLASGLPTASNNWTAHRRTNRAARSVGQDVWAQLVGRILSMPVPCTETIDPRLPRHTVVAIASHGTLVCGVEANGVRDSTQTIVDGGSVGVGFIERLLSQQPSLLFTEKERTPSHELLSTLLLSTPLKFLTKFLAPPLPSPPAYSPTQSIPRPSKCERSRKLIPAAALQ